ncbi:MAG TPA: ABATE domain-containing protein [Candidatus Dormibacteraeota bacterium]|nr:ABATE domain-containing protein [Candidatus Dormibacteraeota bacterium]
MRTQQQAAAGEFAFDFVGGALCLDFANTVSWHLGPEPYEHLRTYGDLVAWARQAGVATADEAATLLARASGRPAEAEAARLRAIELREALFGVCLAALAGTAADSADLLTLNRMLRAAMTEAALVPAPPGLAWAWPGGDARPLEWPLWPVVRDAADLLSSPGASRLAVCANERCGWLFLDRTHRRRWCSMSSCGNRVKAARYYRRVRSANG